MESVRHRGSAGTANWEAFWTCFGELYLDDQTVESVRHRRWAGTANLEFF